VRSASISSRILHGAELGRVGAARASGHHDGDDQHADLPQHQDADHGDHVYIDTELAEVEEALLGNDAADQEGDQQDDGHGLPADAVEMMHKGRDPQRPRVRQRAAYRGGKSSQHVEKRDEIASQLDHSAANPLQRRKQPAFLGRAFLHLAVRALHRLQEAAMVLGEADHLRFASTHLPIPDDALRQPRAEGVERVNGVHVE
jgi:hypothetical protein